jgi:hypothetical protein
MTIYKKYRNAKNANVYTYKIRTWADRINGYSSNEIEFKHLGEIVFGLDIYLPLVNLHFGRYLSTKTFYGKLLLPSNKIHLSFGFIRNKERSEGENLYKYYLRIL